MFIEILFKKRKCLIDILDTLSGKGVPSCTKDTGAVKISHNESEVVSIACIFLNMGQY